MSGASLWNPSNIIPSLDAGESIKREIFVPTAGQQTFTLTTCEYVLGAKALWVFKNGTFLIPTIDFNEATTSTFTIVADNLTAADRITAYVFAYVDDSVITAELITIALGYTPAQESHTHDDRYYTETEIDTLLDDYAAVTHTHTGVYSTVGHTHDDRYYTESELATILSSYALTTHNHTGVYAVVAHNHAGTYATTAHTHDYSGTFAAIGHNHTGVYATAAHNHDSAYAAVGHTHDYSGVFAAIAHNHTGVYSPVGHTHDYSGTYQPISTQLSSIAALTGEGYVFRATDGTISLAAGGGSGGGVVSVTGTAPIASSGGATPAISITAATTEVAGSMSASDKSKLDGIAAGANNYSHPANHAASIITQDENNRFVTDTEKSTWNSKAAGTHNHNGVYATAGHTHDYSGVYATAAQGTAADAALPKTGGTMTGAIAAGNNNITGLKNATFNSQGSSATTSGSITIDWSAAQNYLQAEPSGTITYTFTAPAGVCHLQLLIASDGTSSAQTINFPESVKWLGTTWGAVANKGACINFWYDGTSYWAMGVNQV